MSVRPLALALFAALPLDAFAANCGGVTVCACGDTVTSSYLLPADLTCASTVSNGLVIGAANVVLDGGGHQISMSRSSAVGVRITGFSGTTVRNLRVVRSSASVSNVVGISLDGADSTTLTDNTLAGMSQGIRATGVVSSDLDLERNDVSGNTQGTNGEGMTLRSIGGSLVLLDNDFRGSKRGLTLRSLVGPFTIDPSNLFTNVGLSGTDTVIRLETTTDITLDGLDLSVAPSSPSNYHQAIGVLLSGTTGTTIANCDLSGHDYGIQSNFFGATGNSDGVFVGDDVSDADNYGMELRGWDEFLTLADNTFDLCDNGLRLVDVDPSVGATLSLDLSTSSFNQVGQSTAQTGLKVVRSHDVQIRGFATSMVSRGTGVKIEDSDHIDVDDVLICGTVGVGLDFGIDPLNPSGIGADDNVFGSPANVYVEDANDAGVRFSSDSTNNVVEAVVGGTGVSVQDDNGGNTATVSQVGVPGGFAFVDADGDTCNDLCPGDGHDDEDYDGFCDHGDFRIPNLPLLTTADVTWNPGGGAGSPSVVYDAVAGQYLMTYETQTGAADATCVHGYWSVGLATSPDGVGWTDSGGPLLSPTPGTPYACVAAHPSIVQNGATTVVFFKAEKEASPSGKAQYTGVGRALLSWTGAAYSVAVDPNVVITQRLTFGYIHAIYDATAGTYRIALTRYPRMAVTSGPAAGPFAPLVNVLDAGSVGWGATEVFNPGVACGPEDTDWSLFLGGRATSGPVSNPTVDEEGLGRLVSSDFSTWTVATAGPLVDTLNGDPEMRHWDVLPVGSTDYVVFYDDKNGAGGTNRVLAATSNGVLWTAGVAAGMGDKVCTP